MEERIEIKKVESLVDLNDPATRLVVERIYEARNRNRVAKRLEGFMNDFEVVRRIFDRHPEMRFAIEELLLEGDMGNEALLSTILECVEEKHYYVPKK